MPADEPCAKLVVDGEEVEVPSQLPVVALGGFFEAVKVSIQGILRFKGGAVDALEHGSVFVAAPVGPGNAEELEGGHLAGGIDVGAIAEVGEFPVGVDAEGVILDGFDNLELEGLLLEEIR